MNLFNQSTRYSKFIVRSISSIILIPLLYIVWKGGVIFYLFLIPIFIGMIYETLSMENHLLNKNNISFFLKLLFIVVLTFPLFTLIFLPNLMILTILSLLISVLFIFTLFRYNKLLVILLCGIVFSGVSSLLLSEIHPHLFFYILIIIFTSDIFAYCFGSLVGGPKLWYKVSPNKTWSGSFFGILGALIVSYYFSIGNSSVESLLIGLIISIFAQAGDLLESSYKRQTGLKDSGKIIPGHGGILDRMDGLIISLPVILILLKINFINFVSF